MPKKPELQPIYRCDTVSHAMNQGKEALVLELLRAWRKVAVLQGRDQWREFYRCGRFNARLRKRTGYALVGTSFGQMIEQQIVGVLDSFIANRANDFKDAVNSSSLDSPVRHQLHFINSWKAWFTLDKPLAMKDGTVISLANRRLARAIMRGVLKRHRKPRLDRIGMVIDQRMVELQKSGRTRLHRWWLKLSTLRRGKPVLIPLADTDRMESRSGKRSLTIQVNQNSETRRLRFGVLSDCADQFAQTRAAYKPRCEGLALDVGLKTLLAANDGSRFGQGWDQRLAYYDKRITGLARTLQKQGIKPNRSARYRAYVQQMRGWLQSEIGRILNRVVQTHAPASIVTELLDFRAPGLSRRLNRLIGRFGKNCMAAKLQDLKERFGIGLLEVNPAYSSQECSRCGYVDKKNRPRQSVFRCLWCGSQRNGDGNAACNLWDRRSAPEEVARRHRSSILGGLVLRFNTKHPRPRERQTGTKGRAVDPRASNPYFRDWAQAKGSIGLNVGSTWQSGYPEWQGPKGMLSSGCDGWLEVGRDAQFVRAL